MSNIAVIIVNYNSGALLAETVASVARSTLDLDIFVSDNGSVDGSVERLRNAMAGAGNLHIIENAANLGFAAGNNVVLPRTQGDYLLFLNPDCPIEPDTIERMLDAMNAHANIGMAGCLIRNIDGSEQPGCRRFIPKPWNALMRVVNLARIFPSNPLFRDFNLTGTPLPAQAVDMEAISGAFMLVRRSALEKVGPLDPGYFLHCEDLDWCMRFTQAGYRILFVPDVVVTHVKGACSVNRPIFVEWHKHKGMARFYRKFFRDSYPAPLLWLVYIAIWARFFAKALYFMVRRNG